VSGLRAGETTTDKIDKTAVEKLNDDTIKAAVQGKLAAENIRNLSLNAFAKVEVQAERGSVTLNGVVPNADEKARAEQLAREVNGIKEITNNLKIQSVNLR
jgi:osmotically-inducible protein OsmY